MIINGLTTYFKNLSVGGTLVNVFTGERKKTRLFYADEDRLTNARSIELDATTEFKVVLGIKNMKTPAENQKVYRQGSVVQPRKIEIKAHVDVVKLEQLNQLNKEAIPVIVMCTKNMPSTTMQAGYYADGNTKFSIANMIIVDEGYENSVAVNLTLEEIVEFSYKRSDILYSLKANKATIKKKIKSTGANGKVGKVYNPHWSGGPLTKAEAIEVGSKVIGKGGAGV